MNPEAKRLQEGTERKDVAQGRLPLDKWGPYVAERGWGTVREDYSADGDAWSYFTHDHARSRAYRWCEDGIAGLCDRYQVLLFAPAFWNGSDPILKERLFGVSAHEGNHGEDVKELYYHLDATPTHSYLKYLYKYPQGTFPYDQLVEENQKRSANDPEFELLDTGIFEDNRYFDITIEYAKAGPEDICIKLKPSIAVQIALLYTFCLSSGFAISGCWNEEKKSRPEIRFDPKESCLIADDSVLASPRYLLFNYHLGPRYLYASSEGHPLFTHNDTNQQALWNLPNETPYVKDAFHRAIIEKEKSAVNPEKLGSKAAIHYSFPAIAPGKSAVLYFRLTDQKMPDALRDVESVIAERKKEADLFIAKCIPKMPPKKKKRSTQRSSGNDLE